MIHRLTEVNRVCSETLKSRHSLSQVCAVLFTGVTPPWQPSARDGNALDAILSTALARLIFVAFLFSLLALPTAEAHLGLVRSVVKHGRRYVHSCKSSGNQP